MRSGTRSAVDVVEEHLTAIAARDGEIHAFNLVTADQARQAALGARPRASPPARTPARWPACRWR